MANWVHLPQELLERISDFCITPDQIRMQYVCKSWRSILKNIIHPELPWLMMLPNNEEDPDSRVFYSLSKKKIHAISLPEIRGKRCCGSFQNGWLVTVDEKLDISLFHPWSRKTVNLPNQSTFAEENYRVGLGPMEEIRDKHIRKVALSDDGSVVVFIYGIGYLGYCRIGDDASTDIDVNSTMEDVIFHKGQFYSLTKRGAICLIHIEDELYPHGVKLTSGIFLSYEHYGYLVPDILTDRMFVITREVEELHKYPPQKTMHFDIFGVNLEDGAHNRELKKLTKVESLGDRALFLGCNSPIVVLASQFPGLKGNHIYFTDNMVERHYGSPYGCCDSDMQVMELVLKR
ncbi:hypothetical protein MRB53_023088 [Persea americana]|uniref:Uncharacterized protein n=1 Tax=Persea americana TaxID=3435 RepID=A0ACC2L932_PERAE|nr:hypothetical protein MRB53_023088 [Persea americana]